MPKPLTAPTSAKITPSTSVDVAAVTKRILDGLDVQRVEIARLLRAVRPHLPCCADPGRELINRDLLSARQRKSRLVSAMSDKGQKLTNCA